MAFFYASITVRNTLRSSSDHNDGWMYRRWMDVCIEGGWTGVSLIPTPVVDGRDGWMDRSIVDGDILLLLLFGTSETIFDRNYRQWATGKELPFTKRQQ